MASLRHRFCQEGKGISLGKKRRFRAMELKRFLSKEVLSYGKVQHLKCQIMTELMKRQAAHYLS